jgi:hypothetical protein
MTAGVGQLIQNTDYNSIRSIVDGVMGANSTGYGQALLSSATTAGSIITALQWFNLRTDLVKARQHQIGSAVGSTSATDGRNLLVPTSGATITESLRNQFALFATTVDSNKKSIDIDNVGGQYSAEGLTTGSQTSAWNGTLTHTVTITGATSGTGSLDNLKYFFNAGGSIRISANITSGSSKNNTWSLMFTQMGEFAMNYTQTTYTGASATGSSIGFDDLTTSDQLIGQKAAPSGSYAENRYYIYARKSSNSTQVILTIQFQDNDVGDTQTDENVTPTLNSIVSQYRPSGSNVSVASPTASGIGLS